jgi:hypothetical protein
MSGADTSLIRKSERTDTIGNKDINDRIVLNCILREPDVDRIQLAEDTVQWWASANTEIINFRLQEQSHMFEVMHIKQSLKTGISDKTTENITAKHSKHCNGLPRTPYSSENQHTAAALTECNATT